MELQAVNTEVVNKRQVNAIRVFKIQEMFFMV